MGYIKSEVLFDGNLKRKGQNMKLQVYMITQDDNTYENHAYNEIYESDRVQSGLNWDEMESVWRDLFNERHSVFPRYKKFDDNKDENRWIYRFGGLLVEDKSSDTIHFVQIWASHELMADLIAKHVSENWNGRIVIPEWETEVHKAWLDGNHDDEDIGCSFYLDYILMSGLRSRHLNQTLHAPTSREAA